MIQLDLFPTHLHLRRIDPAGNKRRSASSRGNRCCSATGCWCVSGGGSVGPDAGGMTTTGRPGRRSMLWRTWRVRKRGGVTRP